MGILSKCNQLQLASWELVAKLKLEDVKTRKSNLKYTCFKEWPSKSGDFFYLIKRSSIKPTISTPKHKVVLTGSEDHKCVQLALVAVFVATSLATNVPLYHVLLHTCGMLGLCSTKTSFFFKLRSSNFFPHCREISPDFLCCLTHTN